MNKKLSNKLYKKYPKIFAQKDLPMTETAMCWGFECGDGWFWLINILCDSIQSYIDNNPHLEIKQVEAVQVKEKFGRLRFYYDGGNDEIAGMVHLAEDLSASICEICGSTKNVSATSGWIKMLCSKCMGIHKRRLTMLEKKAKS